MINISRKRALAALGIAALTVAGSSFAVPSAQAAPRSPDVVASPAVPKCSPEAGTVLSSKAITYGRAWLPTSTSSRYLAGPSTISYTQSRTTTTTKQITASFELDEGLFFASAKETYGVSLAKSSSFTNTWSYSSQVPKGKTAKVQVYKLGGEFGIRQRYMSITRTGCKVRTETSPTGNFFAVRANHNDDYCQALVTTNHPKPQVARLCRNKY